MVCVFLLVFSWSFAHGTRIFIRKERVRQIDRGREIYRGKEEYREIENTEIEVERYIEGSKNIKR